MADELPDILLLTRELCAFTSGVVADDNEKIFARLRRELPFTIHRFPSGAAHNGWLVPDNWRVERALLKKDGKVVFEGTAHPLGVAMLSRSFSGRLDFEALKPHLVTNPDQPEAYMFHSVWQVRSWAADWALSVPYRVYKTLGPGTYEVDLRTTFEPGEMLVAEYRHKGRSNKTVLFNTNTCHPTQANDGFCAVSMLVRLFQWLKKRDTYYSYRLILGPEHLGSVHYMKSRSRREIENMVGCVFMEMPGNVAPVCATSTFLGNQALDRIFRNVVRTSARDYKLAGWREGCGNDETVWEAPGHEIPTVEMTRARTPDHPYPEYHSSLDNPDLMDPEMLAEFWEILTKVVTVLEDDRVVHRRFDGLICLSNPDYDLYFERHDPTIDKGLTGDDEKWGHLLDFLFRYFDGSMSVLDIADRHDLPFNRLLTYIKRFETKGLVTLERRPLERPTLSRRRAEPMPKRRPKPAAPRRRSGKRSGGKPGRRKPWGRRR